jgi:subtilisin family serine protease
MKNFRMKGSNILFSAFFAFIILFSSCQKDVEKDPKPIEQPVSPEPQQPDDCITKASADNGRPIPNHYIVKFKEEESGILSETPVFVLNAQIPAHLTKRLYSGTSKFLHAILDQNQLERLKKNPQVESVEPDRIVSITSCYTELPSETTPWGVKRVGYGNGSGKTVWVIDTGVDLDHPDLNVDVTRSKSWIKGSNPDDDHGHGTHVAGTIAAKDNLIGVIGVAANATVVALKVMDSTGRGSTSAIIAAVNHIKTFGKPGDVVNMSIGGDISQNLDNAILETAEKGILFAVAAGNSSMDASHSSPARAEHYNVYTVSAMNSEDSFASFSNFRKVVDFCAPGVNIPSTHKNGGFAVMSGTSMATPHVAGLLLLNGKNILKDGYVKNDPDGNPDPIAHK